MCSNPKTPWLCYNNDEERRFYWFRADCKLWTCPECAQNRKARVGARAGRGAEYFAKIGYPVQFTTLTCSQYVRETNASIQRWRTAWPKLRKRMARACPELHYGLFPEQHKTGAVHVHLLETSNLSGRWYKDNCPSVGLGYMVDVENISNTAKVVMYVTKYMAKAIERTDWPAGFHRFRFSRQWPDIEDMAASTVDWKVYLSAASFDDEARYWYGQGYGLVNTRTGEVNQDETNTL
jgi:hypothetical protein